MRFALLIAAVTTIASAIYFTVTLSWAFASYGPLEVWAGIARSAFFLGLAAFACSFAIRCGALPECRIGLIILAGLLIDPLLHQVFEHRVTRADPTHLIIDGATFIAFVAVTLRSARIWTACLSAFQLLSLGAHLAKALNIGIHPVVYVAMAVMWSYGMLILLIVATRRHRLPHARSVIPSSLKAFLRR